MPFFAAIDDPRIVRIRRSSSFFYWSIKHSKIMFVSANNVKAERKCNLCIPKYRPGTYKECEFSFSTLNSFKRHVMSCEFKFKRPLMWATSKFRFLASESKVQIHSPPNIQLLGGELKPNSLSLTTNQPGKEIPAIGLKREREIGDLRTLQNVEIMRINFTSTKSIVKRPREMVKYFRRNGCHCKDELGDKCNVQLGATFLSMFYHLAHLERERKGYMVFKGSSIRFL